MTDNTTIAEVLPSYYWPNNAVVIVTACSHRHVRPILPIVNVGEPFLCPFCIQAEASGVSPAPQEKL